MKKEDIDVLSEWLSNMKDAINELESASKRGDGAGANASKRKILNLQVQIGRRI
jgi:hypothetical protein